MNNTCKNCRYGKRKMSEEPCFHCEEKDNFEPQTNRQHYFENMSDEEFAKTISKEIYCSADCPIKDYCYASNKDTCQEIWEQWLKAEHKE